MTEPTKSDAEAPIFKWVTTKDGDFKRQVSSFRDVVSRASDAKFKAEPNRYHVYISYACPWAHRVLLVLTLKGLRDIISLTVVDHLLGPNGWKISPEVEGATDDPVNHATYLSEIYFKADKDYSGRYTVPVFWDKKTGTIVNNESSEIIRFLNTEFDEWSSAPGVTYYPENLRTEIDAINEWIYDGINNGVYKCGFATLQEPYEKAYVKLFAALDRVEDILKNNTFLVGNTFTEADIRLFTTIVRFDPVYTHFKCTEKTITHNYPAILSWCRRIYQMEGVKETVNMEHIKKHYYMSHIQINPHRIVPVWNGPDLDAPY